MDLRTAGGGSETNFTRAEMIVYVKAKNRRLFFP